MRFLVLCLAFVGTAFASDPIREIFQQLVEINTQDSDGNVTAAAEAMAARFKAAGFPDADVAIVGDAPKRKNLVVRYRGTGASGLKPILLLAHLDVVEARRSDWTMDPYKLNEVDGQLYGRGTLDDKCMAAIFVANLLRYKADGYQPSRDLILALTAGEESGVDNGVDWLLKNRRDLIDAEYAINEGGGGRVRNGKKILLSVQAAEKTFATFHIVAKNAGGHSSQPSKDNAIYHIADAMRKVRDYDFPVKLTEVTQAFFERMGTIETGEAGRDMALLSRARPDAGAVTRMSNPPYNMGPQLRTTCVATMISGGHAENALPQSVDATVNCRVLPVETIAEVKQALTTVIGDPTLEITIGKDAISAPASKLRDDVMGPIRSTVEEMWPGLPIVPTMSAGATDGKYLRNAGIPTYGVSGMFMEQGENRAHGRDERIPVTSLYESREFLYILVTKLALGSR